MPVLETSGKPVNPIGLYMDDKKNVIGCIDPSQADAVVERGFRLIREGDINQVTEWSKEENLKAAAERGRARRAETEQNQDLTAADVVDPEGSEEGDGNEQS